MIGFDMGLPRCSSIVSYRLNATRSERKRVAQDKNTRSRPLITCDDERFREERSEERHNPTTPKEPYMGRCLASHARRFAYGKVSCAPLSIHWSRSESIRASAGGAVRVP
eukprot:89164-Prymnesium_polylepis.3